MARKVIHQLVDDLDGTVLEPGEGETVLFSLDGKSYEIDLTEQNAEKLREVISPYIGAARRTLAGSAVKAPQRTAVRRLGKVRDLSAVRKWAREQGHTVSDRGRVPEAILEAYDAAH
ncbi:histone-like nucleoid-structuring protein Lsr2 [Microbacterium indicum]|uniref:histone-like nucleoid-structuring protein Lsr2 n=1 Tax=Microbacterium indicum TaxID=358100 RepID=UPI00041A146E|nr:Lsr2 family protein [Microbacterium indicum]